MEVSAERGLQGKEAGRLGPLFVDTATTLVEGPQQTGDRPLRLSTTPLFAFIPTASCLLSPILVRTQEDQWLGEGGNFSFPNRTTRVSGPSFAPSFAKPVGVLSRIA